MLIVVDAIYKMVAGTIQMPPDQETPQQRVNYLFGLLDDDQDGILSLDDFVMGAKKDSAVMEALHLYAGLV